MFRGSQTGSKPDGAGAQPIPDARQGTRQLGCDLLESGGSYPEHLMSTRQEWIWLKSARPVNSRRSWRRGPRKILNPIAIRGEYDE